nr:MAG TPA: hypothetical protein [Caudoviricetes sp.]
MSINSAVFYLLRFYLHNKKINCYANKNANLCK